MKKKEIVTLALTTALLMTAHAVPASAASNAPESMSQTGSIQTITPRWESTNVVVPSISISGETIVYDPETEVIPYSTAYGDAGTAAIYWVNRSQIYWGITSYTKGLMTFAGDVTTNRGGFYLLGDIEFDGSASGNIMGVTTKRGTNTATLSGFMIDAKGVSFTAPDVSSSLTY